MSLSRKIVFIVGVLVLVGLMQTTSVTAHPGNTSSDGGHYCWTRCDYWGEVYGQRHFHNGGGGGIVPTESEYLRAYDEGEKHAKTKNKDYIVSEAKRDGYQIGHDAGYQAAYESSSIFDAPLCDENVKFINTPTASYKSGFDAGYESECYDIYTAAYEKEYKIAYKVGTEKLENEKIAAEEKRREQNDKTKSTLMWVAGCAALVGGAGWLLKDSYSKLKKLE